jgi:hypothetical protein
LALAGAFPDPDPQVEQDVCETIHVCRTTAATRFVPRRSRVRQAQMTAIGKFPFEPFLGSSVTRSRRRAATTLRFRLRPSQGPYLASSSDRAATRTARASIFWRGIIRRFIRTDIRPQFFPLASRRHVCFDVKAAKQLPRLASEPYRQSLPISLESEIAIRSHRTVRVDRGAPSRPRETSSSQGVG